MKIEATARRYEPTQVWTEHRRVYYSLGNDRKRAINWALHLIQSEFPDYPEYEVTVIEP